MIAPMIGEIFESSLKGTVYEVIRILDQMVILQSLDGLKQILTSKENLNLFYQRARNVEVNLGSKEDGQKEFELKPQ